MTVRQITKYAVILYVAQALLGIGVGLYAVMIYDQAEVERLVDCVTHQTP
jgi:hypothetical protein